MIKNWKEFLGESLETAGIIDAKMQELKDLVDAATKGQNLIYEWESKDGMQHMLRVSFSAESASAVYEFDIDELHVSKTVDGETEGEKVGSIEDGLDFIEKDIQSVLGISESAICESYTEESEAERLPFWKDFLQKFNMLRNKSRKYADSEIYSRNKNKDLFHDDVPSCDFLDEWDLEGIKRDWVSGFIKSREYGSDKDFVSVEFEGIKSPEIGDIIVKFRSGAWIFKPDSSLNYRFSSSGKWPRDENYWDDIKYMDQLCKGFRFKLDKIEVPIVYRKKAARNIRPNILSKETGYKMGRKKTETDSGFKYENLQTFEEFELTEKAKTPGEEYKGHHIPAKYLKRKPVAMKKEIDRFRGKKEYKKDWEADYDKRSGKRIKTKKSAATKAYQKMFGKKD